MKLLEQFLTQRKILHTVCNILQNLHTVCNILRNLSCEKLSVKFGKFFENVNFYLGNTITINPSYPEAIGRIRHIQLDRYFFSKFAAMIIFIASIAGLASTR